MLLRLLPGVPGKLLPPRFDRSTFLSGDRMYLGDGRRLVLINDESLNDGSNWVHGSAASEYPCGVNEKSALGEGCSESGPFRSHPGVDGPILGLLTGGGVRPGPSRKN
jgi:hypothetical protein